MLLLLLLFDFHRGQGADVLAFGVLRAEGVELGEHILIHVDALVLSDLVVVTVFLLRDVCGHRGTRHLRAKHLNILLMLLL